MDKTNSKTEELLVANKKLISEIEKQKLKLTELQNSNKLYSTTFDTISDSICLIDADANILLHNKSTETLLNKTTEQLKGKNT